MCNTLLLVTFFPLIIGSLELAIGIYEELNEGSQCTLENGNLGVCKKLPDCPSRLKEVRDGRRSSESTGRCGFDNFTEIVCCPVNITDKIARRPAEIACQQYDNEITINDQVQSDLAFHIFGGVEAQAGEFPYMVALGYTNDETGGDAPPIRYSCGGSLISSEHVLTAAHCVNNINEKVPVEVRLGSVSINGTAATTQRIPISDIISHPEYRRSAYYNDVAILKLKTKVQMSNTVKPICLQTKSLNTVKITPRTALVVIGWGATITDFEGSNKLMRTPSLSLVESDVCSKSYGGFRQLPRGIDDSMICAIDTNSSRRADACQGDSGGPLLMLTESGDSVIGITAFGQSCGGDVPGVYTAVHTFLDWIEEHVWPSTDKSEEDTFSEKIVANISVWFTDIDE